MESGSMVCWPPEAGRRTRRPALLRWWRAARAAMAAAFEAGRCVLAEEAGADADARWPPGAMDSLRGMDDHMLADIGLPPEAQAAVVHRRVRQQDGLWALSRGAVPPGVERSFY